MAERGCYVTLAELKTALGESAIETDRDAALLAALEDASRFVDQHTARKFYVVTATRYYSARNSGQVLVDDLLAVTTLKTDSDGDRTYEETWTSSDYDLEPDNGYPKWRLSVAPDGDYSFPAYRRGVEIAGTWGFGDGESASPWKASGATVTVATANGTTVTASDGTLFAVGQTILAGSEQMYITAIAVNSLTCERAVNGTTGAAQAGVAASIAQYPRPIRRATLRIAARTWRLESAPLGVQGGADMGVVSVSQAVDTETLHWLAPYRRMVVG